MIIGLTERKPITALLALLLLHVTLLSVQVRDEDGVSWLEYWSSLVFSPIAGGLDRAASDIVAVKDAVGEIWTARDENQRLKDENVRLNFEIVRLREQLAWLPRAVNFSRLESMYDIKPLIAGVIQRTAPYYNSKIIINAGSEDGVERDWAVLAPGGIVGRVILTTPYSSQVEVITTPRAGAGVLIGPDRIPGFASGDGSRTLKITFVQDGLDVNEGDVVVTSGTDEIYPKGHPVGKITKVESASSGERLIEVELDLDPFRLEEVAVVKKNLGERPPGPTGRAANRGQ